jgi:hypothetical protein
MQIAKLWMFIGLLLPIMVTAQKSSKQYNARVTESGDPMVGLSLVSNIPGAPFGIAFPVFIKNSRVGVYGDFKVKFTNNNPKGADLTDSVSRQQIETYLKHPYMGQRQSDPFSFCLGVTIKSNTKGLVYYVGAGARVVDFYRQYFDPSGIWGNSGNYYIRENREVTMNITGGAMYIFKKGLILQGGFDTAPLGLHLGVGIVFSRYWN